MAEDATEGRRKSAGFEVYLTGLTEASTARINLTFGGRGIWAFALKPLQIAVVW